MNGDTGSYQCKNCGTLWSATPPICATCHMCGATAEPQENPPVGEEETVTQHRLILSVPDKED